MDYKKLAQEMILLLGGNENIKSSAHCVTRLRLTLYEKNKAQTEAIKALPTVINVVELDESYQIIIGTAVIEVYNEFRAALRTKDVGDGLNETGQITTTTHLRPRIEAAVQHVLRVVSETMTSIIEVLLAAGMLAGFMSMLNLIGLWQVDDPTYVLFDTLRNAVFHFLPVFIAASAAKRLGVNEYVAMLLALSLLSKNIDGAADLSIFGYVLPEIVYANTFIPILLGVVVLGFTDKLFRRIIPQALQYFLVPMCTLVLTFPLVLIFFGPLGTWIGEGLHVVVLFLTETVGSWLVVGLYAAFQPFLIIFGAHNFTYPLILSSLSELGYDPLINHAATISDVAVAGALLGYFLRTKKNEEKQLLGTMSFSALLGITEPAIFGVFLKYRRPFLAVIVGGGLGGLIAGLAGVKTMGMVWGLTSLPTYLSYSTANFVWMVVSVITSFVLATVVGYGLWVPAEEDTQQTKKETQEVL